MFINVTASVTMEKIATRDYVENVAINCIGTANRGRAEKVNYDFGERVIEIT